MEYKTIVIEFILNNFPIVAAYLLSFRILLKTYYEVLAKYVNIKITPTKKLLDNKAYQLLSFLVDVFLSIKMPGRK